MLGNFSKLVSLFLLLFVTIGQRLEMKCTTENIHHTLKLTIVYYMVSYGWVLLFRKLLFPLNTDQNIAN